MNEFGNDDGICRYHAGVTDEGIGAIGPFSLTSRFGDGRSHDQSINNKDLSNYPSAH
jgi:hypothetical protein